MRRHRHRRRHRRHPCRARRRGGGAGHRRHCQPRVTVPDRLSLNAPPDCRSWRRRRFRSAFLTASYGLDDLASLRRGERVLIHAAAGGVGLAAVQLASVWVPRCSPPRAATPSASGCGAWRGTCIDSRTLDFRDEIRAHRRRGCATSCSTHWPAISSRPACRSCAPRGRFLEIGQARRVVDRRRSLRTAPTSGTTCSILAMPLARCHAGVRVCSRDCSMAGCRRRADAPARDGLPAARCGGRTADIMAQARHIGKLVVRRISAAPRCRPGCVPTRHVPRSPGGLARWACPWPLRWRHVARAMRSSVLPARSRRRKPRAGWRRSRRAGSRAADAARRGRRRGPAPMLAGAATHAAAAGVVHAAGVIDDAPMARQTWARFAAVLRPKLPGALAPARADRATARWTSSCCISAGVAWLGVPAKPTTWPPTLRSTRWPTRCAHAAARARRSLGPCGRGDGMAADRADAADAMWRISRYRGHRRPMTASPPCLDVIERQARIGRPCCQSIGRPTWPGACRPRRPACFARCWPTPPARHVLPSRGIRVPGACRRMNGALRCCSRSSRPARSLGLAPSRSDRPAAGRCVISASIR